MGPSHGLFNLRLFASREPDFQLGMNARVAPRETLVHLSDDGGRLPNLVPL